MTKSLVSSVSRYKTRLWRESQNERQPFGFGLEITARCNFNCRHCFINLSARDTRSRERELSLAEIANITGEAFSCGALGCLLSGGEPLLRDDFFDLYRFLKKKGFLVSLFTNASLITKEHVRLFQKYPLHEIEVTVYGVTQGTYESVTRTPGSFRAFMRGVDLLLAGGIEVTFKAMAMRTNVHELPEIARFCRARTKNQFRFDPFLHLRFDADPERNTEILAERLSPEEIVGIEKADFLRFATLKKNCHKLIRQVVPEPCSCGTGRLFYCGAGVTNCLISPDGFFRICPSLVHPSCVYDLRAGNFTEAWNTFVWSVRGMKSKRKSFLKRCHACDIINLCMWCPAHAHLETGKLDKPVGYFCEVAHARAEAVTQDL